MVFRRFDASMVTFSSLPALVSTLSLSSIHAFEADNSPCDRIDFYVGNVTNEPLYNLHTFFAHNGWVSDRTWKYDVVVAVGYNALSDMIVDIPASLFPWCLDYFGVDYLDFPISTEIMSEHLFRKACLECRRINRRCALKRVGGCPKCPEGQCKPNVELELETHHNSVCKAMLINRHALCPAFLHLLTTVGNFTGYHNLGVNAADTVFLADSMLITGRSIQKEVFIRAKAVATQLVHFINGRLLIVDEFNMGKRLGFAETTKRGKAGFVGSIPTFGIDNPLKSYSLMNAALRDPGNLKFADAAVWDKDLVVSPARILMLAQYESSESLWIMVGWM